MRRFISAFAAIVVVVVIAAPPASAVGPGGWDRVGHGAISTVASLNGAVYALNTQRSGVLYAGGAFTSAGGHTKAQRIAAWNGTSWSSLGNTPITNGAVHAIAYDAAHSRVFVGGTFLNAGGHASADFLAVWNGSTWAPFCNPTIPGNAPFTANVNALQIVGNNLYVGGSFANGAGIDAADYLVRCNLTTGVASATVDSIAHAFGDGVYALTADSNGTLYAGGQFIDLEGVAAADHVAVYDGNVTWQPMGSTQPSGAAVDSYVRSLAAHGTDVYIGTDSLNVAGIANADHVARWNGTSWSAVGSNSAGTNGWFPASAYINALATYGSLVIAAGYFQNANGTAAADDIAYFDGGHWRPIGSNGAGNGPLSAHPAALGVTGGKVYAGGPFTSAGGDSLAEYLASYALRQPDASIGGSSTGPFVGNNVYSATGVGETRRVTVARGRHVRSYVRIQNDGLVAASFQIKGAGGARGIAVRYYRGTTNVTSRVRAGTYSTGNISARASILLRVVVTVARSSATRATFTTTCTSTTGTPRDANRLRVRATS